MDESLQMLDIQRNPYDQELCPIYSCSTYMVRTSSLRTTKYLFCTATHPYRKMSSQRLSNLVRKIFIENGILPSKSRRIQSARSVVSSYLFNAGVPLDQVRRSGAAFFKHYYKKPATMSSHQFRMNVSQLRKDSLITKPGTVKSAVEIPAAFSKPVTVSSTSKDPQQELQSEVEQDFSLNMEDGQISTEQDLTPSKEEEGPLNKSKPHKDKYKRIWARITDPSRTGTPSLQRANESFFTIIWSEADIIQPLDTFLADSSVYLSILLSFHISRSFVPVIHKDPGCIKQLQGILPLVPEVALQVQVLGEGAAVPLETSVTTQILWSVKATSVQSEIAKDQTTFMFSGDHTYVKNFDFHPWTKEAMVKEFRYAKPLEVNIHKCALAKSKVRLQVTTSSFVFVEITTKSS